jgi:dolichol-phosphate mannosyltransferase
MARRLKVKEAAVVGARFEGARDCGAGSRWYTSSPSWPAAMHHAAGPTHLTTNQTTSMTYPPATAPSVGVRRNQAEPTRQPLAVSDLPARGPDRRRVLVVVPTYNEHDNLGHIMSGILAATSEVDALIVDDNSPDGTGRLADEISARETRVRVLHRARKEGLGRAYLAAFGIALSDGYELVVEMDADLSHDPKYLPELIARADGADVVIASRTVPGGGTMGWGLGRRLLSRSANLYARTVLGVGVHDLTSGFKCFRREVLEAIDLSTIASAGYAFQIELTYRAVRCGFRVSEMPIIFVERRRGRSKMSWAVVWEAAAGVWPMRSWQSFDRKG